MKLAAEEKCPTMEVDLAGRMVPQPFPASALPGANLRARLAEPVSSTDGAAVPTKPASSDAFQLYLREIGRVKLLSRAEEIELASRIQCGDEQAREQMINGNLRLVIKIARDYEGLGLPLLDLINEGNIGLMKGVERFDPRKAKFSTYAAWWIKQSIKRALANQTRIIRLPVHVVDKLAQIRKTETRLRELLEREPTVEEIAEELAMTALSIRQYKETSQAALSLDAAIDTEDSGSVSEIVADENAAAPFDRVVGNNERDLLYEVLATLAERESKILAMRFGLDGGKPKTLDTIAEYFGVTRERIRQVQEVALLEMRKRIKKCERPGRPLTPALVRAA
ncbi:MAG: polymerase, sigma 70 subunit, RpoD subfamily [Verrucomicrobiales bacterium]|nr:polymerase, sigma 70 subunit, RpoD subfamily [Verrucomicrobiales bacterium]